MPLTESQVNEMASRIEEDVAIDIATETQWIRTELAEAERRVKEEVLAFRLFKAMRNDDAMTQKDKVIAELRKMIEYHRRRLAELQTL